MSAKALVGGPRRGALLDSVLSHRGEILVSETQRFRMLGSAIQVIAEHGYGEMSVARITAGAGVSRRTFYDLFEDREDCFVAVFDHVVSRARELIVATAAGERGWREQTRAGLCALLLFLDREPGVGKLLVVDALKAGARVQRRRAELLAELSHALHEAGFRAKPAREIPALMGEGVVGAVLGVIHTRLLAEQRGPLVELLNPLMGVIVLPYLGAAIAQRELVGATPEVVSPPIVQRSPSRRLEGVLSGLPMRITYRTLLVLEVIGRQPGASNRQVADLAGVTDQGQISKLLARLEGLGLINNTSEGQPSGEPNAWRLTPTGEQLQHATQTHTTAEGTTSLSTRRRFTDE